jgi:peptide/nickel transport system substrate-binding protein
VTSRYRSLAATALIVGLVAAACSKSSTSTTSPTTAPTPASQIAQGGNLTFAIDAYPQDLDPLSPTVDITSLQIFDSWWEYLVRPTPDGSTFEPMLATSWTISPDKETYTFNLRQGVKFSDGTPMTTHDVVESLQQAFSNSGSQISFLGPQVTSVTAPTPSTVVIQMKSPWAYMLADLSGFNAAILPYTYIDKVGYKTFLQHPYGTGPFMLTSMSAGSSVTVSRNPYYWEAGHPYLDSITFVATPSDIARATAVTGGQADISEDPPLNQVASLKANSAVQVYVVPASQVETIVTNVKEAPLDNEKIRQAISLAIDRSAIVKAALFGYGSAASTFIVPPPGETLQDTSLNLYPYNPTMAKALVQQSGIPTPIDVTFSLSQGAAQDAIAAVVQQDLQVIGINVNIVRSDFDTSETGIKTGNFKMATTYWTDYIGDPSEQPLFWMDPAYCCEAEFTFYDDPTAVALAHQAVNATDTAQAKSLFDQVQESVATSAHAIPLYYPDDVYVSSSKVAGFAANPFGYWYFDDFGFKK